MQEKPPPRSTCRSSTFHVLDAAIEAIDVLRPTVARIRRCDRDLGEQLRRALSPKQPHYMDPASSDEARLVPGWNLIVPVSISERTWEEPDREPLAFERKDRRASKRETLARFVDKNAKVLAELAK